MTTLPRRFASTLALPALILLAACTASTGGATASVPGDPSTAASPPAATSAAPSSAATNSASTGGGKGGDYNYGPSAAPATASADPGTGDASVSVATGATGPFLTGANGLTLYTFDKDSANSSACGGGCVGSWPPFIVAAGVTPTAGAGVTGTLTTFARADGTMQVAHDRQPLYYFAGDTAPGDANGDGLGGVWFIATP